MQSVHSAVGALFFKRLLLPLQSSGRVSTELFLLHIAGAAFVCSSVHTNGRLKVEDQMQASAQEPERLQKTAATSALGLAILSSLCQSIPLAQSQEMIDLIPIFVKVIRPPNSRHRKSPCRFLRSLSGPACYRL